MTDLATLNIRVDSKDVERMSIILRQLGEEAPKVEKATDGLRESLIGVAKAAISLKVLNDISGYLRDASNQFADWERSSLRLQAVLEATGRSGEITVSRLQEMSEKLGRTTLASAEDALRAAGILATFGSVASRDLEKTLNLAQDMAEAFGTDLAMAARKVGTAFESPSRGLSQMAEMGIVASKSQMELVRALEESGNKAKATEIVIGLLNDRIGGAGIRAADGLAGSLDNLRESTTGLSRELGQTMAPGVKRTTDELTKLVDVSKGWIDTGLLTFILSIPAPVAYVGETVVALTYQFAKLAKAISELEITGGDAIKGLEDAAFAAQGKVKKELVSFGGNIWELFGGGADEARQKVSSFLGILDKDLLNTGEVIKSSGEKGRTFWNAFIEGLERNPNQTPLEEYKTFVQNYLKDLQNLEKQFSAKKPSATSKPERGSVLSESGPSDEYLQSIDNAKKLLGELTDQYDRLTLSADAYAQKKFDDQFKAIAEAIGENSDAAIDLQAAYGKLAQAQQEALETDKLEEAKDWLNELIYSAEELKQISVVERFNELKTVLGETNPIIIQLADAIDNAGKSAERTWRDGATAALREYYDTAKDEATGFQELVSNSFSRLEDGIRQYTRTGKFEWKSMITSMLEDLAVLEFRKAAAGLLGNILGDSTGGGGTIAGSVANAAIGAATGAINVNNQAQITVNPSGNSQGEIGAEAGAAFWEAVDSRMIQTIQNERRPGGVLT
jgi:hypothetical protein